MTSKFRLNSSIADKKDDEFVTWNRFPMRDPTDRIIRVKLLKHNFIQVRQDKDSKNCIKYLTKPQAAIQETSA